MPLAKSKTSVGLGNSLMNDRFGKGKGQDMRRGPKGIQRTAPDGTTYVTTPKEEAAWMKMRSITEQNDLDDFLSTAELAGTDFTAEKMNNIKIIHRDQKNPYLLSAAEERATVRKQNANKKRLKVPRRPLWDEHTTPHELDERERQSLLEWRRGLAEMQESDDLLLTPFERNLEVWRQLWRVIERSDLVVQIVDARNPLLFRCEDLENYVKEVDPKKNNLLLVNKADMMTLEQRQAWAKYLEEVGINFRFFSAELAKDLNHARDLDSDGDNDEVSDTESDEAAKHADSSVDEIKLASQAKKMDLSEEELDSQESTSEEEISNAEDEEGSANPNSHLSESTRILTTDELESLFLEHAPSIPSPSDSSTDTPRKTQIGLVGYPNVGKSSTINALIGAKKVSVSATPGKTKHFQTIHLSEQVILCDCPGLVFPNFANTKAELVCAGVLPIDQMREYTGPAALVAARIPKSFLEAVYGMKIPVRAAEDGGTGIPTGEEVLRAYATARGFSTTGLGQPDESRAVRYVLKDYVRGKLLYCHPPPSDPAIDGIEFNRELYDINHLPLKRRARAVQELATMSTESDSVMEEEGLTPLPRPEGRKTQAMNKLFFGRGQGNAGHLYKPFEHHKATSGGKDLSGRKLKSVVAMEKDVDVKDLPGGSSKKHFKGNRSGKTRNLKTEYV